MRSRIALALVLGACATPAVAPDASTDAGTDAPYAPRDVGTDTGFDAAALGTCDLARPMPFPIPAHTLLHGTDVLADRDFYALTVLETLPAIGGALSASTDLTAATSTRAMALAGADAASCDPTCARAALVRTDDAATIDATISALAAASVLDDVASEMRASLRFERFVERGDDDATLVRTALTEAMADLASAFDAYAIGELPPAMLATVVHDAASGAAIDGWWQPLLRVTVAAMRADGRDEAVRYEPLDTGENATALAAIATTDFSTFPYVAILVPGEGPTDATTALNPQGAARCDLAVARYQARLAPFLLVSGGHVHPDRTVYSEAIEMKRYLMTTYAVPESAILVDPYARHTTTNLRNAVRELFAYGAPTDGHLLIVSDAFQSAYIASDGLATRCDDELFFRPFLALQVLSRTDSCITMAPASMTYAASDALDP